MANFWSNLLIIVIGATLSYILIEKPAIDARAVFKSKHLRR